MVVLHVFCIQTGQSRQSRTNGSRRVNGSGQMLDARHSFRASDFVADLAQEFKHPNESYSLLP